ncbi:MAG: polysaccharide deacetylase family protein [Corynebacterium kroppenstedtii]|nr:polysaccharide deacetylase family protein [Corynebacterium kroppenstedtii]
MLSATQQRRHGRHREPHRHECHHQLRPHAAHVRRTRLRAGYFETRTPRPPDRTTATTDKVMALSIDDAPSPHTDDIMSVLRDNDAHATFFVIGSQVDGREPTLEKLVREGHELGNHAMHDESSRALSNDELERQLQQKFADILDSLLDGTTGSYMYGKHILEAQIMEVDKGKWLESARDRYNVDAIVYAGDDTTDENAFRVLHGNDVSIKVGDSHTAAVLRVPDTDAIADVYQRLATMRREYLTENGVL